MRVDHVLSYKVPKEDEDLDELTQKIHERGVAPDTMREYDRTPEQVVVTDDSDKEKRAIFISKNFTKFINI